MKSGINLFPHLDRGSELRQSCRMWWLDWSTGKGQAEGLESSNICWLERAVRLRASSGQRFNTSSTWSLYRNLVFMKVWVRICRLTWGPSLFPLWSETKRHAPDPPATWWELLKKTTVRGATLHFTLVSKVWSSLLFCSLPVCEQCFYLSVGPVYQCIVY